MRLRHKNVRKVQNVYKLSTRMLSKRKYSDNMI